MKNFLETYHIPYDEYLDLRKVTWIHRGGVARWYIVPNTVEQLSQVYQKCISLGYLPLIVGHTSNIYIYNSCNLDVVISTRKLQKLNVEGNKVIAECGTQIKKISKICISKGLGGFEGLINLPGTAAAAIVNNAGCFGCLSTKYLVKCDVLNPDGSLSELRKDDFYFTSRSSIIKRKERNVCILRVVWELPYINSDILEKKAVEATFNRRYTQEGPAKNLGSTYCEITPNFLYKNVILLASLLNKCASLFQKRHKLPEVIIKRNRISKYTRNILLFLTGYYSLKKYISQYSIQCFVWRDESADIAFEKYKKFIKRITKSSRIEIEIYDK